MWRHVPAAGAAVPVLASVTEQQAYKEFYDA
jgi:hypothetical protein